MSDINLNVYTQTNSVSIPEGATRTLVVNTAGPRGPSAADGINGTARVNGSVVYYDGTEYKADATWTTSTLTFGGNF